MRIPPHPVIICPQCGARNTFVGEHGARTGKLVIDTRHRDPTVTFVCMIGCTHLLVSSVEAQTKTENVKE